MKIIFPALVFKGEDVEHLLENWQSIIAYSTEKGTVEV
jgi:hypothetical protein